MSLLAQVVTRACSIHALGFRSIDGRQNDLPWGSAVPEAAQPQPLP